MWQLNKVSWGLSLFFAMVSCVEPCPDDLPNLPEEHENLPPEVFCRFQPEKGRCRALICRYYYNLVTLSCEEFYYGGCSGNRNNFWTIEECQQTCPWTH